VQNWSTNELSKMAPYGHVLYLSQFKTQFYSSVEEARNTKTDEKFISSRDFE